MPTPSSWQSPTQRAAQRSASRLQSSYLPLFNDIDGALCLTAVQIFAEFMPDTEIRVIIEKDRMTVTSNRDFLDPKIAYLLDIIGARVTDSPEFPSQLHCAGGQCQHFTRHPEPPREGKDENWKKHREYDCLPIRTPIAILGSNKIGRPQYRPNPVITSSMANPEAKIANDGFIMILTFSPNWVTPTWFEFRRARSQNDASSDDRAIFRDRAISRATLPYPFHAHAMRTPARISPAPTKPHLYRAK